MNKFLEEVIGWYGAFAIILGYSLISFSFLKSSDISYQLLNFTGAASLAYISLKKKAYQPGIVNIIWLIIALVAILNIFL